MTALPKDVVADLRRRVAELEQQLQSSAAERDEAIAQQAATAEILQIINSSPADLAPVFEAILDRALRPCEAQVGVFWTYDGELMHASAIRGAPPAYVEFLQRGPHRPSHVQLRLLGGTEGFVQIADLTHSEGYRNGDPLPRAAADLGGIRTLLVVPLRRHGAILGTFGIYRQEVKPFTDRQITLVESFAAQAVIAIENARLFNETKEALERQTATAEILKVIASSPSDIQPVFDAIATRAKTLIGGFSSTVFRFIDGIAYLKAFTPTTPAADEILKVTFPRPVADFAPFRMAQAGEVTQIPDTEASTYELQDIARARGYRSMLFAPLMNDGVSIGFIAVTRVQPGSFADHHVQLLRTFADQAVIAIENARLFEEVQAKTRDLTESLQQQIATADVLKVISRSAFDLQTVLDTLVESAARLCEADMAAITRRRGDVYYRAGSYGFPAEFAKYIKEIPVQPERRTITGRTLLEGRIIHVSDVLTDPEYDFEGQRLSGNPRTFLGVPLLREGVPIGALTLTRSLVRPFTEQQIELIATFADQAVIAIENVRLFDEVQAKTRDLTESLQQQTATAEVLKVISRSAFDLQTVLDTLVSSAVDLSGAFGGSICLREGDGYRYLATSGIEGDFRKFLLDHPPTPGRASVAGRVMLSGNIESIRDVLEDPDYVMPTYALNKTRAALGVPLLRNESVVGALVLNRTEPGLFTTRQIELVQTFADQAVIAIENARLFDEVQAKTRELSEALTYQTGSSNILGVIASSPTDVRPVLKAIVESARELCEADDALVVLKDGNDLVFKEQHGSLPVVWRRLPINRNWATGRTVVDGIPVHVHDLLSAEGEEFPEGREIARRDNVRTILTIPLLREQQSIGAIVLRRTEVHPFSDKQIALLQTFADQAVIAISNVRLFDEVRARTEDLRESLEFQTATSDVLKVISSSPDSLQPVLDVIVETSRQLCGTETSTIFLLKDEKFHIAAASGARPEYMEFLQNNPIALDQAGSSTSRAAREKRTVHIPDIGADPEFGQGPMGVGQRRALLSVPLMREGTAIGVITMRQSHLTPFTERQIEVVQTFADQAVIAISNVRLFEEVQARTRDLSESLQQQTATADVLKVISRSAFDLQVVLQTLVESAARLCDADGGTITRQKDGAFYRAARFGISREFMDQASNIPVALDRGSATGRVLLEGVVVHIPDVQTDPDYHYDAGRRLTRTLLGVPMMREGAPIGVLILARSEARPFTEKQIELVKTFADQAVIAIENVRLFDEVQARTRELSKSLDDLRTAQDRLVQTQKLASLGQLTAGIAHEIKNPLNFVNNFAALSAELTDELNEVLAPSALDDKTRENVDEITRTLKDNLSKVVQHGKRADSIVKNMLLHSREGSGEHRPSDINALLDESLNLAYHGARAERREFNVTLQRDFDATAGTIEVFPQEITRVFLNLIANGFYAVTKRKAENGSLGFDPVVRATTKNLGDTVEIRIRDNGTGIPAEVKEKMFNPFFTTKPAGEGTGLGLSMSHDIVVKQHGGTIDVETEPGRFTEFRIVLPRTSSFSNRDRGQT